MTAWRLEELLLPNQCVRHLEVEELAVAFWSMVNKERDPF